MERVTKKFRLKGNLIDLETHKSAGLVITEIYGACGNEAVGAYVKELRKDGYDLDESYSYAEIGTVSSK